MIRVAIALWSCWLGAAAIAVIVCWFWRDAPVERFVRVFLSMVVIVGMLSLVISAAAVDAVSR